MNEIESFERILRLLADELGLGSMLFKLNDEFMGFELLEHWTQGEFHHDFVFEGRDGLLPPYFVVSTNCNGGIKEILGLNARPDYDALWHHRCPENPEFKGELSQIIACARTQHWFEPAELLVEDARSELRPEYRERQKGGGWIMKTDSSQSE